MIDKITTIKERILLIPLNEGISKRDFCKIIDMSESNFNGSHLFKPIKSNYIVNIITNFPDVDLHWLITGEKKKINYELDNEVNRFKEKEGEYSTDLKKRYDDLIEENREIHNENRQLNKELKAIEKKMLSFKIDNQTISTK